MATTTDGDISGTRKSLIWLFLVLLLLGMLNKLATQELRWLPDILEESKLLPRNAVWSLTLQWLAGHSGELQRAMSFALTGGALAWAVWRWMGHSSWHALLALALYGAGLSFFKDYIGPIMSGLTTPILLIPSGILGGGRTWQATALSTVLLAPWSAAALTFQLLAGMALIDARLRRSAPWWILFGLLAALHSVKLGWVIDNLDSLIMAAGAKPLARLRAYGVDVGLYYALQGVAVAYAYNAGAMLTSGTSEGYSGSRANRFVALTAKGYLVFSILLVVVLTGFALWQAFSGGRAHPSPVS